jgi:hypothetical protein
MSFDRDSERQAAIAAIGRGEFQQIGRVFDENQQLSDRLDATEAQIASVFRGAGESVADAQVIDDDAKTGEIRDGLIGLTTQFNALLASLRAVGVIGEDNG